MVLIAPKMHAEGVHKKLFCSGEAAALYCPKKQKIQKPLAAVDAKKPLQPFFAAA